MLCERGMHLVASHYEHHHQHARIRPVSGGGGGGDDEDSSSSSMGPLNILSLSKMAA